jgi:hypothetical protein
VATALPEAVVRPILAYQTIFRCKKVACQPFLLSLHDPLPATAEGPTFATAEGPGSPQSRRELSRCLLGGY